jgi:hypothetical protein
MTDELLHSIARLIEDYQRVFDWTATDLDRKFGKAKDRSPYFPLLDDENTLSKAMGREFSSVPAHVFAAILRHQPFQPGKTELGYLHDLTRVNKHQDFTEQTLASTRTTRTTDTGTGEVDWTPVAPSKGGVLIYAPSGSVVVDGVVVAEPDPSAPVEMVYARWIFVHPPVPVYATLEKLARLTTEAVEDVRHEAGL